MKKNIKSFGLIALTLAALSHIGSRASAQTQQVTLRIGDPAPELKYSQWIKGTPIDIKGDQIYVVECWATWCIPCVAAMPHLSALSKKYADKAVFIGCNVWEEKHDRGEKKPYEAYLPAVKKFVALNAGRMVYNVIADNNAQEMANKWLTASGQVGIPATFVIKNNKLMWIGHPMKLDNILDSLVNGNYDLARARKTYEENQDSATAKMASVEKIRAEVQDAVAVKDYQKALSIVNESAVREPVAEMRLKVEWFEILLAHFNESKALEYFKEQVENDRRISQLVAGTIAKSISAKEGFSKDTYLLAAATLLRGNPDCMTLDLAAQALKRAGDSREALRIQTKAVALAKIQAKDPLFAGRVFDQTIIDFQAKADTYRKSLR